MCGAEPVALTSASCSRKASAWKTCAWSCGDGRRAAEAGVPVVTGDTKVVDRGKGDGIYVNTSGIGRVRDGIRWRRIGEAGRRDPGLRPVGDHGIAVRLRATAELSTELVSDSACVLLW